MHGGRRACTLTSATYTSGAWRTSMPSTVATASGTMSPLRTGARSTSHTPPGYDRRSHSRAGPRAGSSRRRRVRSASRSGCPKPPGDRREVRLPPTNDVSGVGKCRTAGPRLADRAPHPDGGSRPRRAQLDAWLDTDVRGQPPTVHVERTQRFDLTAGSIERKHVQRGKRSRNGCAERRRRGHRRLRRDDRRRGGPRTDPRPPQVGGTRARACSAATNASSLRSTSTSPRQNASATSNRPSSMSRSKRAASSASRSIEIR